MERGLPLAGMSSRAKGWMDVIEAVGGVLIPLNMMDVYRITEQ